MRSNKMKVMEESVLKSYYQDGLWDLFIWLCSYWNTLLDLYHNWNFFNLFALNVYNAFWIKSHLVCIIDKIYHNPIKWCSCWTFCLLYSSYLCTINYELWRCNLKQISRHEAETLFQQSEVLSTKIEHDPSGLKVSLQFSEDQACVVHYNRSDGQKKYFLDRI